MTGTEQLYAELEAARQKINRLELQCGLAKATLELLAADKWARGQVLKYGDSNVGVLVDEVLVRMKSAES